MASRAGWPKVLRAPTLMTPASGVTASRSSSDVENLLPWCPAKRTSMSGRPYAAMSSRSVDAAMSPVMRRSNAPAVQSTLSPSSLASPAERGG